MAGVELQHRVGAQVDVEVALGERAVLVALGDPGLALAVQHIQPVSQRPQAVADVGLAGEDPIGVEASHRAQQERVGRPLELIVEHARRRLGPVEGAGGAVDHLDAGEPLPCIGGGPDQAQPVHPRVLDHAALEAPRLRA